MLRLNRRLHLLRFHMTYPHKIQVTVALHRFLSHVALNKCCILLRLLSPEPPSSSLCMLWADYPCHTLSPTCAVLTRFSKPSFLIWTIETSTGSSWWYAFVSFFFLHRCSPVQSMVCTAFLFRTIFRLFFLRLSGDSPSLTAKQEDVYHVRV